MKSLRLSRRTVLRGAGVSVALPWLEAMSSTTRTARAASPKRFLVFFSPNGHIRDAWVPTGDPAGAWMMSRTLQPIADKGFKDDVVVIDGVDNVIASRGGNVGAPGDDHQKGMGSMLTAVDLQPGSVKGGCDTCPAAGLSGGISVDQRIVQALKPPTRFPSLELGVQAGSGGTAWGYSNYKAPGQALPLDNSPASVFTRVFNDFQPGADNGAALMKLRNDRKSVLDAVMANYKGLQTKLGADDRKKLDQHLTAVQELEGRIFAGGNSVANKGCAKPMPPAANLDFKANDNFPMVGKLQMDLMAMAMACDLTRVCTIQWENSVGGTRFTWLGATRGHHDMSHDPDTALDTKEMLTKINVWFAEQFAYLIGALKSVPEDNGTMLDNTLILWCNELSRGNAHSHPDMPYVLAGRAGGKIKTGRWLRFTGTVPHNNLLLGILNAMDVPDTSFGMPMFSTGPLTGLL